MELSADSLSIGRGSVSRDIFSVLIFVTGWTVFNIEILVATNLSWLVSFLFHFLSRHKFLTLQRLLSRHKFDH